MILVEHSGHGFAPAAVLGGLLPVALALTRFGIVDGAVVSAKDPRHTFRQPWLSVLGSTSAIRQVGLLHYVIAGRHHRGAG